MPEITIRIEVPEDFQVRVDTSETEDPEQVVVQDEDAIRAYLDFATENTQSLFKAMAEVEVESGGPFTFEEVAKHLEVPLSEVLTYNRNAGRGARLWREQHDGNEPPVRAIPSGYASGRRRKNFRLPDGVAQVIIRTL